MSSSKYYMYINKMQVPIMPDKIEMKIKGQNESLKLINFGEITAVRPAGLTEISFELLLPNQRYPFAAYKKGKFRKPKYYLDIFEKYKTKKKTFQWIVTRRAPNNARLFYTNMKCTLEDYTIKENAKNGNDVVVKLNLKQYKDWGVKKYKVKKNGKVKLISSYEKKLKGKKQRKYTTKNKDTLWSIAKRYYNNGSNWTLIYDANEKVIEDAARAKGKISSMNGSLLYAGTKLTIPALLE